MAHIPLSVRIRAFCARDEYAFWWSHFSDEEKELARMDVWQLAGVLEEAGVRTGMERKRIVAEHMLSVRLAKIQAQASWGSGILGFVGAVVGAALLVALTNLWQQSARPEVPAAVAANAPAAPVQSSSAVRAPVVVASVANAASTPRMPSSAASQGKDGVKPHTKVP